MTQKPAPRPQANRREFIKTGTAIGAGFWVAGGIAPKRTYASKLEQIQFGCIGIDGKGSSDSADAKANGEVVAVCDIDDSRLDKFSEKFAGARRFNDFRILLDEMGDKIDAVTVSTPDHTHAVAALQAMRLGKHCFCQKPLTHSIEEARMMGMVARERNLVTQMGNQGTAESILRKSAALIQAGAIGQVTHVHVWTNRPVWPQGMDIKVKEQPDPGQEKEWNELRAKIHWEEWIGPARPRPYSPEIHPFKWRGFWDFGTGALGDMACHTLNMAFMALNLKNPTSVKADTSGHDGVMFPKWSQIDFEFPELDGRPALTLTWYDGGKMPPTKLIKDLPRSRNKGSESVYNSGALVVGTDGMLFSPGDYGGDNQGNTGIQYPNGKFVKQRRIEEPKVEFQASPGHFKEFANAIADGNSTPVSNFPDFAGPLTETILLGNLAVWAASDEAIQWDAENMIASNVPPEWQESVEHMVRHKYLNGYDIRELAGTQK